MPFNHSRSQIKRIIIYFKCSSNCSIKKSTPISLEKYHKFLAANEMAFIEDKYNGEYMWRKFHDHSYSTGWDIAMYCIFLLFCLYVFFLSIISFGDKMQRRTKAAHNEHYRDKFLNNKEEEEKRRIKRKKKKHLFGNVITIGFLFILFFSFDDRVVFQTTWHIKIQRFSISNSRTETVINCLKCH